jgi:predicted RNase H-like HicB family nuclease/predicted RNA binding protein YcfA (HicA-like mRNA interferase family)
MKLRLVVEKDAVTGRYSAVFPELPGCASAGDTEAEAIQNAEEALELWFEPTPMEFSENAKLVELTVYTGDRFPVRTAPEVTRVPSRNGFGVISQRGSHKKWRHLDGRQVIVADHGNKPIPIGRDF